jgi:hypothetical protein
LVFSSLGGVIALFNRMAQKCRENRMIVNKIVLGITSLSLLLAFGCSHKPVSTPRIVMDDWWNLDFANSACWAARDSSSPWCIDVRASVEDYESQFASAFALDPACHGVQLVYFDSGEKPLHRPTGDIGAGPTVCCINNAID